MSTYTASQHFPSYLESVEGFRPRPYQDSAGVWTIGIGSTTYDNGDRVTAHDAPITHERALQLAAWEAKNKGAAVARLLQGVTVNANQFDALLSLAYNIGVSERGFAGSTVLKRVRANPNDPTIRDAFMMWNKITDPVTGKKVVCPGLNNRRIADANLYFTPVK